MLCEAPAGPRQLALGPISAALQDEVHLLAGRSFLQAKGAGRRGMSADRVVQPLLRRWGGLLAADGAPDDRMTGHLVALALATCLQRVGVVDTELTDRAIVGIEELNAAVWLSDAFDRQSPQIVELLRSSPVPLTRVPTTRSPVTFTRPGDLLAIRTDDRYVVGHVHGDTGLNEAPIIELYETVFADLPAPEDVVGTRAAGQILDGDRPSVWRMAAVGLRHLPDPAGQITLLAVAQTTPPDASRLADPGHLWSHLDLFEFLDRVAVVAAR